MMAHPWGELATWIELAGALLVAAHAVGAMYALCRRHSIGAARAIMASGAIAGLDFKTAATLLKTLELATWRQLGMFAAIFALRVVLKKVFQSELSRNVGVRSKPSRR